MKFSREHPCKIKLLERLRLSGQESNKDVWSLIFDANELNYENGDYLAIYPKNNLQEVNKILSLLGFSGEETVTIGDGSFNLKDTLLEKYCITHLPKRFLSAFRTKLNHTQQEDFDKKFLGEAEGQYSLCELISLYPDVKFQPIELCKGLKKLSPRLYSIASATVLHGSEIHLIVGTVNYRNFLGNMRYGVASYYLNYLTSIGEYIEAYVCTSHFRMPSDSQTDMIMVGPGTGLAPFMSFLYEQESRKLNGKPIGNSWLFFGGQHESCDFIERDEIMRLKDIGVLNKLDLAFSRDQASKIYVQDKMWEARHELWDWLKNGANFYVCGNASHMALDVEQMLKKIAIDVGGIGASNVNSWMVELRSQGRYQKDVY